MPRPSPRTTTRRRLSEVARHAIAPSGVVKTDWPAVDAKARSLGIKWRWWQPPIGRLILALRADGTYASTIGGTGLSIPRQVGKTFLIGAIVFCLCLLRKNLTVIWTAHRVRTAGETFTKMKAFARRKRIAPFVSRIVEGDDAEIHFRNGSRILFGARESGFGLGFDEVDVLIFDEAQRLKESTLDDMIPATNQSRQPQGALLLFLGTPPRPTDAGEVFKRMREDALAHDGDTAWVEFGADPDYVFTPPPETLTEADWEQIRKANPSFPEDTSRQAILRMRKKLGPSSFGREGAGQWDPEQTPGILTNWSKLEVTEPPEVTALGVALDVDRVWTSIGAATVGEDLPYVGTVTAKGHEHARMRLSDVVELTVGPESRKVPVIVAECKRIQEERGVTIVGDKKGPIGTLEDDFTFAGVDMLWISLDEYVQACSDLFDACQSGQLVWNGDPDLAEAVESAGWRRVVDRQVFARRAGNIVELEAVTVALYGANQTNDAWGFWET